ncbi:Cytochrome P450 monooxygenase [Pseudocercospora fuligena]|uniref:Cytochrome P450 monooxygenase n=1 Tax=Pseudocercospora fuligena TaxID=685502 RepID=A0A8H6R9E5_9PEZI|nr:Cytochrome P450 monooxygenase [Pseudocercospora fuligena]
MSTIDVSSLSWARPHNTWTLSLYFAGLYLAYYVINAIYSAYFGPLSKFPGPKSRGLSKLPYIWTILKGTEGTELPELHEKYGPVVRIAPDHLSFNGGALAWKDIYGFKKNAYKDPFFYGKPFNGVASLITADDENHSRQRKLVSHAFADKTLRELEPMLKKWVGVMKQKMTEKAVAGEKSDMLKFYNCTTFDIMGDLSFNEGLDMLENGEYSSWVKAIFLGIKDAVRLRTIRLLNSYINWFVVKFVMQNETVRKKAAEHWNYSKERVDRRLAKNPEQPDLWSKILEKSDGPGGLTVPEHHSLASLFMIAGTETTATALSGVTYYLLKNPDYLKKLTTEIREAHASFDDLTLESIAKLKYLHAVLQEGLRVYPPVPCTLPRLVPKGGASLDGEYVPEGTTVGVHQLSTYRSSTHWTKPYEFHPERWLGDPEFAGDHLDSLEPFSTGPRNCIGKNLAWHEMRLILATTLLCFDLELCEESKDWADQKIFTLWEKVPLMCRLTPAKA